MTLLDIITKWAGISGSKLIEFLEAAAAAAPDLAPKAEEWIDALKAAGSPENLVALASVLPAEIANIAQGKLDPRDHPSDDI